MFVEAFSEESNGLSLSWTFFSMGLVDISLDQLELGIWAEKVRRFNLFGVAATRQLNQ